MRPALLDRLFAPVTVLPGIGPQLGRLIERAAGPLVVDLLWHLPTSVVDRRAAPPIRELNPSDWPDAVVTLKIRVERHEPGFGRRPYRVYCTDGTGTLTLVYFSARGDQLQRLLPVGAERIVSGTVDYYSGRPQMAQLLSRFGKSSEGGGSPTKVMAEMEPADDPPAIDPPGLKPAPLPCGADCCPAGFLATSLSPLPQLGHLMTCPLGWAGTSICVPHWGHFTILAMRPPIVRDACYRMDEAESKKLRC